MAMTVERILIILAANFLLLTVPCTSNPSQTADHSERWCVADAQTPDEVLEGALNWACSENGGANCSMIQENQPCYLPNTMAAHASYAFNSYYQKFKTNGGSCFFHWAAMTTDLDPSHDSCHYEYNP